MKKFLSGFFLLLGSHGARLAGLIACQAILVRCAGETQLGHFSYFVGVFTLLGTLADLGIGPTAAKEVAEAPSDSQARACAAAMRRKLVIPLLVYLVLAIGSAFVASNTMSESLFWPGVWGSLLGAGFAIQVPLRDLLSGKRDLVGMAVLNSVPFFTSAVGISLLAWASLLSVGTSIIIVTTAHTMTCLVLLQRAVGGAAATENALAEFESARRRYGWGVSVGRIVGLGAFLLDVPILGFFWEGHLAAYAAIKTVSQPFAVASTIVSRMVFRKLVSATFIPKRYQILNLFQAMASGTCLLLLGFPAIRFIYVMDPGPLRLALMAQATAVVANVIYSMYNTYLGAQGRGRLLGVGGVGFGLVSLITNCVLIPWRGVEGACLANAICNTSWLVFCLICYKWKSTSHETESQPELHPISDQVDDFGSKSRVA